MFYRNTRYSFDLPEGAPDSIPGGIIAASALKYHRLKSKNRRRSLKKHVYLQHRLFDPQLYLATLNPISASKVVGYLSSYPWFVDLDVPEYKTREHKKLELWEEEYEPQLLAAWTPGVPTDPEVIEKRIRSAIHAQLQLECEAIILPSPMISVAADRVDAEMQWLDIGLRVLDGMNVPLPTFVSVAITQNVLAAYPPEANPTLSALVDQITAREVDGVYFVMEQTVEMEYCPREANTLKSILSFIDDLVRLGRRRCIVNYLGVFGAITSAAGAEIWSGDFYRSSRGLRMTEMLDRGGSQRPRYFSPALLGDIGLEHDLERIAKARVLSKVRFNTPASEALHEGLERDEGIVYEWRHAAGRTTPAKAHFLHAMVRIARKLDALDPTERVTFIRKWLEHGVAVADLVQRAGVIPGYFTELQHQQAWLDAYSWWVERTRRADL